MKRNLLLLFALIVAQLFSYAQQQRYDIAVHYNNNVTTYYDPISIDSITILNGSDLSGKDGYSMVFHQMQKDSDKISLASIDSITFPEEAAISGSELLLYIIDESFNTAKIPYYVGVYDTIAILAFIDTASLYIQHVFLDFSSYVSLAVTSTNDGLVFYSLNPNNDQCGNNLLVYKEVNGQQQFINLKYDWESSTFIIDSIDVTTMSENNAKMASSRYATDPFIDKIYEKTGDFFHNIGDKFSIVNKLGDKLSVILPSNFDNAMLVPKIFEKFGYGMETYIRMQGSSESRIKYIEDKIVDETQSRFLEIFPFGNENQKDIAAYIINSFNLYDKLDITKIPQSSMSDDDYEYYTNSIHRRAKYVVNIPSIDFSSEADYSVTVNVSDITENSVFLSGSYKKISGNPSIYQMGYILRGPDGKRNITDWELAGKQISGLMPSSTYYVYAYLNTTGTGNGRFASETISFTTKSVDADFAVTPTSISFPAEGGEATISVSFSPNVKWSVISSPSWLDLDIDSASVSVYADENEYELFYSGSIIFEAKTDDGLFCQQISVLVEQEGIESQPIQADWIFEGTWYFIDKDIIDGEEYTEEGTIDISMTLAFIDSTYCITSMTYTYEGETVTSHNVSQLLSSVNWLSSQRDEDGWLYSLKDNTFSVTDSEIKQHVEIEGDLFLESEDVFKTSASTTYYYSKKTGSSYDTSDITLTGLDTDCPVLVREVSSIQNELYEHTTTYINDSGKKKTEKGSSTYKYIDYDKFELTGRPYTCE
ncbi:MAG: BACON domain-containing protein [Bacteroidaceae bacterium]|nr:BACON domain-containing protein [Bacteroidaceae bacterium]